VRATAREGEGAPYTRTEPDCQNTREKAQAAQPGLEDIAEGMNMGRGRGVGEHSLEEAPDPIEAVEEAGPGPANAACDGDPIEDTWEDQVEDHPQDFSDGTVLEEGEPHPDPIVDG
jgi:hypothetical protein